MGSKNRRNKLKGYSSSSFIPDVTSSSLNGQMRISLKRVTGNSSSMNTLTESTTERRLKVEISRDNTTLKEEMTTSRNIDLIKRKMMLMQIDMAGRYGPNGLQNRGLGSDVLPLLSGQSSRPNVFETREERKRRLLDEERYCSLRMPKMIEHIKLKCLCMIHLNQYFNVKKVKTDGKYEEENDVTGIHHG